MNASTFTICDTPGQHVDALFNCTGPLIYLSFTLNGRRVSEPRCLKRSEAADIGRGIAVTGEWPDGFPSVGAISTNAVKAFGERLRDYGINGS